MIIQCPNCFTSFNISDDLLAEGPETQFHCSRCDHSFVRQNESAAVANPEPAITAPLPQPEVQSAQPIFFPELEEDQPKIAKQLDLLPVEKDRPKSKRYEALFGGTGSKTEHSSSYVTAEWPGTGSAAQSYEADFTEITRGRYAQAGDYLTNSDRPMAIGLERPKISEAISNKEFLSHLEIKTGDDKSDSNTIEDIDSFAALGETAETPRLDVPEEDALEDDLNEDFSLAEELERIAKPADPQDSLVNFSFNDELEKSNPTKAQPTKFIIDEDDYSLGDDDDEKVLPLHSIAEEKAPPVDNLLRFPQKPEKSVVPPSVNAIAQRQRFVNNSWIACSGPIVIGLLFGLWSLYIDRTPEPIQKLLHISSEDLPHVPPAGVELTNLSSRTVPLSNGKNVLEIYGDIANRTASAFSDIVIEAQLYDADNKELDRLAVYHDNNLSDAKLEAFSDEMLTKLQTTRGTKPISIESTERTPFRLVFPNANTKTAWYSARIYSVREVPVRL